MIDRVSEHRQAIAKVVEGCVTGSGYFQGLNADDRQLFTEEWINKLQDYQVDEVRQAWEAYRVLGDDFPDLRQVLHLIDANAFMKSFKDRSIR